MEPFDLVVVGGGVNGAGIARDAAGRGLKVLLCEKDDLAQGTSSRSGKLVHGGLRYLEYYEFRLVREALIEREVLLRAAPHIIWPMRFVLPHVAGDAPGLARPAGAVPLRPSGRPQAAAADPRAGPAPRSRRAGRSSPSTRKAFEYSDCWVDDARLVVLNALDARARGAEILTRTALVGARRDGGLWQVELEDRRDGQRRQVQARAVVNAAGPWVEQVLGQALGVNSSRRVRLVKGSHLVTRKFWEGNQAYLLQNTDKRVIFVNPYEGDLALIGTTDIPVEGRPRTPAIDAGEIDYLLDVLARYFTDPPGPDDIVHSFSGVRPLYDDSAENPSAVTRDYVFDVEPKAPCPGRRRCSPSSAARSRPTASWPSTRWTSSRPSSRSSARPGPPSAPMPGGDMPDADFERLAAPSSRRSAPWLPAPLARHYGRLYGTRAEALLEGASGIADLGPAFRRRCSTSVRLAFLMRHEWAETAEDILTRRTKHGLHLTAAEAAALRQLVGRAIAVTPGTVERLARQGLVLGWRHHSSTA